MQNCTSSCSGRIIGITPFEQPDFRLVSALQRAGAEAVLDLGHDQQLAAQSLAILDHYAIPFGVRLSAATESLELPARVDLVVLPAPQPLERLSCAGRSLFVQVCSVEEALRATELGADALIVKGNEAAGRVGDEPAFILLQRVAERCALPLWLQGGIGLHTAGAAIAGGARGVVLDSQLALLSDLRLPPRLRSRLETLDGSETFVANGKRWLRVSELRTGTALLDTDLGDCVPAGQDAAFAKPLARQFGSARGVVRGLSIAIAGHIRQAKLTQPLSESSSFARAAGVRYPIVQGPMTRVSDCAAFAEAVAEAGAMPFLALSLMRKPDARALLMEASRRLQGRAWGVGILGFAPEEIRNEQLASIEECRPPYALIAGGRPAQARSLEERGIRTFLHVPSPGLLDLFLQEGARRFVFEGRECGGHVGPRSSFVLWEQAVARLCALEDVRDLHVLFAGGIHDARSAAMVSALCGPLYARGAKVAVLVGTAYLFTREAVESCAITPEFQRQALVCENTVLLETAAGHATRAAATSFPREFERERQRLISDGVPPKAQWTKLEELNLGRLRVASKGLYREGTALLPMDESSQRREGLYMMGQVAALRSKPTTLAELHHGISMGSSQLLSELEVPNTAGPQSSADQIAIIGMSCLFPEADGPTRYFRNIMSGRNCIREVPDERWNKALYYDPRGGPDKTPSKWGGFLPAIQIEPQQYGIPPRAVGSIDPGQLLSLHVVERALADAGLSGQALDHGRTSVIFGAEAGTEMASAYVLRCAYPQLLGPMPAAVAAQLPDLTEDSLPGVLANVITGRIANRLDFGGVNYTVNAACASSLAALDAACKELTTGCADLVVAGAADVHNGAYDYLMFASVQALSPTGACKTFDSSADGIVLGEGAGAVVLKRLADAERDGDRIYALLHAVAGSSDGRGLGLTAPGKAGQRRALERAYERAGMDASELSLIEAHGTGTVLGDRTELSTLTEYLVDAGAAPGSCTLGSVKSQIGHTKCAAGMAGLIKVALSAYHGVLPPTFQLESPNTYYDSERSPFVFRERPAPWLSERRLAAVSAFGFGGTNFHAVIEGYGAVSQAAPEWPVELFVFRGADRDAAFTRVRALLEAMTSNTEHTLPDLAASAAASGAGDLRVQLAFVAESRADLAAKLERALGVESPAAGVHLAPSQQRKGGALAFLFPGQGSQHLQMGSDLFLYMPSLRARLSTARMVAECMFPGRTFNEQARAKQEKALTDTRIAQPALGLVELALAEFLEAADVRADLAGGHSYGELAALAYAGAIDRDSLLPLSVKRAEALHACGAGDRGSMAAVDAPAHEVKALLDGSTEVVIANYNGPRQTVVSGSTQAVDSLLKRMRAAGLHPRELSVACAFHSPLVADAERRFGQALRGYTMRAPRLPVWSGLTGQPHADTAESIADALARQLVSPVRFEEQVRSMYAAGARVFLEVGPRCVLTGLVNGILANEPHVAIAMGSGTEHSALHDALDALARLAVLDIPMNLKRLFDARGARAFDLQAPPLASASSTSWLVDGHFARPLHGELPLSALKPCPRPIAQASLAHTPALQDAGILEYLRNMREIAERQSAVMLQFVSGGGLDVSASRLALPSVDSTPVIGLTLATTPDPSTQNSTAQTIDVGALLKRLVSERTGYPEEMLDLELDLEADLGIDSIKRTEIAGSLVQQLGLDPGGQQRASEQVVARKTLGEIGQWLEQALGTAGAARQPSVAAQPAQQERVATRSLGVDETALRRYELQTVSVVTPDNGVNLRGQRIAVTDDHAGLARALALCLEQRGAQAFLLKPHQALGAADGLICLEAFSQPADVALAAIFRRTQEALADGCSCRMLMAVLQATTVTGISGLLRSVAREQTQLRVRLVEHLLGADPATLAESIVSELVDAKAPLFVSYANGMRQTSRLHETPRSSQSGRLSLDSESVVLVTGGGRGITARCALALGARFGCRLELVGSAQLSETDESPHTVGCSSAALRRALASESGLSPREIEARFQHVLKQRELRANFQALRAAGVRYRYHSLDVRDGARLGALIDNMHAEHGRLDGVIHGAGVIEDRLLVDKSIDSFCRVFEAKANAAAIIARKLIPETQFLVFFSSISGVLGSRGQADYAAANAYLDELAHQLAVTKPWRVLSIDWGPWSMGMVHDELARDFEKRGIALIEPQAGASAFVEELIAGDTCQAVLMAGRAERWGIDV